MKPEFITFTGIDDKTDVSKMQSLSSRYPIEWGMLLGGSIAGNRYPKNLMRFRHLPVKCALHLCGAFAQAAMHDMTDYEKSIAHISYLTRLRGMDEVIKRVQINATKYNMDSVVRYQNYIGKPVIIQHRTLTFPEPVEGVQYLFDKSGGKGAVSRSRPIQARDGQLVGYAGGIGPDNVTQVLEKIDAYYFWIDMETKIRTDDWFDLNKCEEVCKQIWD